MTLLGRLFGSVTKKHAAPRELKDIGHPIMPERTDAPMEAVRDVSASEAAEMVESGRVLVLDVRFEHEYRHHRIPGSKLVPLPALSNQYQEMDPEKPWLVVCEHGMRSFQACSFLNSLGFKELYNMVGGMSVYRGKQEGTGISIHSNR